jgi:hypothetical protein
MKVAWMVGIGVSALVSGCATPKVPPKEQTTKVFAAPFDRVWPAVISTVTGDYPVQAVEKGSGVLETQMVSMQVDKYANPPTGLFLPCWGEGRGRLSLFVRPVNGTNTSVRIKGHFEGFEYNVAHTWYVWTSTGVLEGDIASKIAAETGAQEAMQ